MANHGYVTSRKPFAVEKINEIIERLNTERFGNLLTIERYDQWNDEGPGWRVGLEEECNFLSAWLKTTRKFEIRHSGRGDFMWWVDSSITRAIAKEYDGIISDDGHGDKYRASDESDYEHFKDYIKAHFSFIQNPIAKRALIACQLLSYPKHIRKL